AVAAVLVRGSRLSICYTGLWAVIHHFSTPLAHSPCIVTSVTSLILTVLLRGWRQQKRPFRKHSASVQRPAKHALHEHIIFLMDTSITRALWLNWKLLARRCPIIRGYFE